jgi:hypothetical protein
VAGIILVATSACKQIRRASNQPYIIGANDIKRVDTATISQLPVKVVNASVLITTQLADKKVKFCSGTLIGPAPGTEQLRVLTNHHCFATPGTNGQSTANLYLEACTNTEVLFGFAPGVRGDFTKGRCEEGTMRSNYDADVAVFVLNKNPPEQFQPLELWEGEIPQNRKALIVHYPDVEEHLVRLPGHAYRLPSAAQTTDNCEVLGKFPVSEWDLDHTLPYSVRHTCDLIHGSSGSGLIDLETNKLLGVNWGGIKVTYQEGVRTDNVATQAEFVRAFLADKVDSAVAKVVEEKSKAAPAPEKKAAKATGSGLTKGVKNCGVTGEEQAGRLGILAALLLPLAWIFGQRLYQRRLAVVRIRTKSNNRR